MFRSRPRRQGLAAQGRRERDPCGIGGPPRLAARAQILNASSPARSGTGARICAPRTEHLWRARR
eukprot:7425689-Alexandrium_andersonii.AAC.1